MLGAVEGMARRLGQTAREAPSAGSGRVLGGQILEDHLAKELGVTNAGGGVEDLEAAKAAIGVEVRADALGQVLGARGRIPELDVQGISFFVLGDLHEAPLAEQIGAHGAEPGGQNRADDPPRVCASLGPEAVQVAPQLGELLAYLAT